MDIDLSQVTVNQCGDDKIVIVKCPYILTEEQFGVLEKTFRNDNTFKGYKIVIIDGMLDIELGNRAKKTVQRWHKDIHKHLGIKD